MEDNPSPEEIRKRRLAYFELNNSSLAASAAFEKETGLNTLNLKEKSSDLEGKLTQTQPLADDNFEQKSTRNQFLSYQNHLSATDKREASHSLERLPTRKISNEATPKEATAIRAEIRDFTDKGEGEKSKTDSFTLLREELRAKAQCGDEEGYNSAVERLISLAKQEIAESENQKNSSQNSAKARYSEHSPRYLHHGETSLQKKTTSSSQVSPKIDYVSSKKENLSPIAVEYEDFFSKSSKLKNSGKSPQVKESLEETEPHQLFQKSLGNVDDLGLSTHRPEEKPVKSIENFIPGEMRQVLGEEKYNEFLKKSTKDIDHLNSDRSSSVEEKLQKPEKPKLPEKPKHLKNESGLKLSIEKDISMERKSEKEKPRLNRPRFEPSNIYSQENEDEAENLSLPPSFRNGYESVHRNVVFSSDEIYHQAYLGQSPPVNKSYHGNPVHLSRDYSNGQTTSAPRSSAAVGGHSYPVPMFSPSQLDQSPFPSSQVPPHHYRTPYPPQEEIMYTARSQQSELYRQMYSGVTPRPAVADSKLMDKPDIVDPNMYKPWPPEVPPQQFYDSFMPHNIPRSQDNRYLAPHMSHPLEGNHFPYPVSHMPDNYYPVPPVPHSPDSRYVPQVPQSPDGRYMPFQVPRPPSVPFVHSAGDASKHYQRRHEMMHHGPPTYPPQSPVVPGPEGEGGFPHPPQRHGGIPYPPPPVNVDLASYFSFLAAQGYPVPYPVPVPGLDKKQPNADPENKESQEKENGDEEMLDMMIPHPPLQRKDSSEKTIHRKSSPRKIVTQEEVKKTEGLPGKKKSAQKTDNKKQEGKSVSQKHEGKSSTQQHEGKSITQKQQNSSQRHVEEIRQFHEQRRQQEAEEDALLEKQRKFAKSSIDRYFSSLEKLYYRDRQEDIREEVELEEILEDSPRKQETEVNTEVNTQVSKATSVKAEGITERMNKMGLDLSFLRETKKRPEESQIEGKSVLVCEDCGEVNKAYMSWCGDCGESLAGVEVTIIKKSKPPRVAKKERTFSKKKVPSVPSDSSSNKSSQNDQFRVIKKESQDSGVPSSEERENTQAGREIEEIFEHVTDPVMKGFINSYFRKKHSELLQNPDVSDQVEDLCKRNDHKEGKKSQSESEAEDHIEVLDENNVSKNHHSNNDIDMNDEDLSKYMDNEEVWFHEREKPKEKPLKHKRSAPIDVEVFSVQESRQQRDTCRSQEKIVPSLNLCMSSDEDKPRPALDVSTDSEDWQDFFLPKQVGVKVEIPKEPEETRPFLEQVIGDMRSSSPTKSKSRNTRPERSGKMVKSIVRESIEAPGYERKWQRSSIAWSSYHTRELSTKSSLPPQRPGSAGVARRGGKGNTSGSTENLASRPRSGGPQKRPALKSRPLSADPKVRSTRQDSRDVSSVDLPGDLSVDIPVDLPVESAPVEEEDPPSIEQVEEERTQSASSEEGQKNPGIRVLDVTYPKVTQDSPSSDLPGLVDHRLQEPETVTPAADAASVLNAYHKYHEMTPRIRDGNFSVWLCLPDELLLNVLSYLPHSDLIKCARTCQHFYRVCMDNTLWRYITIKKNHNLTDESLEQIGRHRPVSLALIQCHGDYITAKGLRNLFRACASSLKELNFFGCSRGALMGDCILLHATSHCKGLTHIDASWCNVSDSGIGALANSSNRLESLCISGCQMITNEGLITVIKKHGKWLRVLEMFGCFNIKANGIEYLAANCINLKTLNLGQCYKLTDSVISRLSTSLSKVETLDLRGCKKIKDNCIRYIVKYCNRLQTIILANCPNITDISLLEISTYLKDIRSIDVCGCRHVTDGGVRALANNCTNLRSIDISSTGCTHRSVLMMANFCSPRLESVKLNFLSDVTEHSVIKLIKHSKRLKLLHLYGCTSIRSLANIRDANPNVKVEM